jgi:hypothetical protein
MLDHHQIAALGLLGKNLASAIGRIVVDTDDLLLHGHGPHARQQLRQRAALVVNGNDHRQLHAAPSA